MEAYHQLHPEEKLEFHDLAASDATLTLELAQDAQKRGVNYIRFHASDKAHEFFILNGLDPRSKDALIFDAAGNLLQASSPQRRLWVRQTLVESYPDWKKRWEEKLIMWLNGTLRFGGRKSWVNKMETLYRRYREGAYQPNGHKVEVQTVDLINSRARKFAEENPGLFVIDPPTDIRNSLNGPVHGVRIWSLLHREEAYHDNTEIDRMLTTIGESIVVGGLLISGTKGTIKNRHALIREVYIVRDDHLELQRELSVGDQPDKGIFYPTTIPLRPREERERQAA
jgi:hypothetical protein